MEDPANATLAIRTTQGEIGWKLTSSKVAEQRQIYMKLISSEAAPEDFFFEPIEYVFQVDAAEWSVAFIPTVPHGSEAEVLHGDLFECRIRDIGYETIPVAVGSAAERSIIDRLQTFADTHKSRDEQCSLRDDKFPRMSGEMVGWKRLLWFIAALDMRARNAT